MTIRRLQTVCAAAFAGAASAFLLIAVWATVGAMWRSPASRFAAFLDPHPVHRVFDSSAMLDAATGAVIGFAIALLVGQMARADRWLACFVFLSAFAAASSVPAALHEGWSQLPKVLVRPLLLGFVVAAITGFWLAPRIRRWSNPAPERRR
jgi:hypothetical protein